MKFDIGGTFESVIDRTREVAETAHVKAKEFHENYVSKVLPDCGKYGEVATFVAEMAPGVSEYNAIKDGDWQAFAIAAGIDVGAVAIGAFTAGAGYAVVKGGNVAAKTGTKFVVKEIIEAGTKKGTKKIAETGTEKIVKEAIESETKKAVREVIETGTEKMAREVVEDGTKKTVKEVVEKGTEKVVKEVGEKIDKKLIPEYLQEVEKITGREINPIQMKKLQKALREQEFAKLDTEKSKLHRKLFDNARDKLIDEWEKNTGDKWPEYAQDVLSDAGEIVRKAGQRFDAHHLIESSYGGPNAWWNLHPAAFPTEHQAGIHATGSLANKIF